MQCERCNRPSRVVGVLLRAKLLLGLFFTIKDIGRLAYFHFSTIICIFARSKNESQAITLFMNDNILYSHKIANPSNSPLRVLSLFSGCGGMDLGLEGGFLCHNRSVTNSEWIESQPLKNWSLLKRNQIGRAHV